jgi:hypothetical protein
MTGNDRPLNADIQFVPTPGARLASEFMVCCAESISLTTDDPFCEFIFSMLVARESCVRPVWAPIAAVTRLRSMVRL